jgi:hypothetical protein
LNRISDVRESDIYAGEPLVSESSPCEVEITIAEFKKYKSPDIDQIPAKFIQAGAETLGSEIHMSKVFNFVWNKEELPDEWKAYYCTSSQEG